MSLLDKAKQHKAANPGNDNSDFKIGTSEDVTGAAFEGKVTAVRTVTTKYGEKAAIEITLDDGKTLTALGFRSGLEQAIKRANPQVGERVATWYEGPKTTKSGNTFHVYEFYTEAGLSGDADTGSGGSELPF